MNAKYCFFKKKKQKKKSLNLIYELENFQIIAHLYH